MANHITCRLRETLPDARIRRGTGGIAIPAQHAPDLRDADINLGLSWTEDAELFVRNRERTFDVAAHVQCSVREIIDAGPVVARLQLADVHGIEILDDHQAVNVAAMTVPDGFGLCVFDEQGTGKTVTAIYAFDALVERDEVDFALIVAPKSMVPEWPNDIQKFKPDLYSVAIATGSRREKRQAIGALTDVLVTNFETVVSMEAELQSLLRSKTGRAILVVDESFFVKNLDAYRTQALRRLRERCVRAFVLCGTPAPNAPHDLVQQFALVDFGLTFRGVNLPIARTEARPIVRAAIDKTGLYVRHLKTDVLSDLPAKVFHRVVLPMAPEQKRLYSSALRDFSLDLKQSDDVAFRRNITSFLARRSALLQVCSNPAGLGPGYDETPAKLLALDEILKEIIDQRREKVLVWSFYKASLDAIVRRYENYGVVRYDGTVADVANRREAVRRFQQDSDVQLFVANPAAAGAGLTLHRARYAVYESLSNQAAHYLQSLDRIHRRGQERDVEYLILLCKGTLEISEYERLTRKERAAQDLLGDLVEEPISREGMLVEVLSSLKQLERG